MKIIGIDPGTLRLGYGVLEVGDGGRLYAVCLGDVDLRRSGDVYQRLGVIFERVGELIDRYRPDEMALEAPFMAKNPQSTLKLGRAQGVAMAAGLSRGLTVFEYAPRRIKQAITGNGAAAKEQVAAMLGAVLGIEYDPRRLDATDGLAVALCRHFESGKWKVDPTTSRGQSSLLELPRREGEMQSKSGKLATQNRAPKGTKKSSSWDDFIAQNPGRVK